VISASTACSRQSSKIVSTGESFVIAASFSKV
jgi:hypothetical protein